jgi:hypothetical protein
LEILHTRTSLEAILHNEIYTGYYLLVITR